MGDSLTSRSHLQYIENLEALHDLGNIDLTLSTTLLKVTGTVIDGQTTSTTIAGADVWLSIGVDQSIESLRLLASSNVARKVVTDSSGKFNITGLRPGNYSVLVSKAGYLDQLQGRVTISANANLSFSILRTLNTGVASITLRWAASSGGSLVSSDLDSHFIRLSSSDVPECHIYYRSKTSGSDSLDRDDQDYEGPETITFSPDPAKKYVYYLHNYKNNSSTIPGSFPKVTLRSGNVTDQFELPIAANTTGRYWRVFDIVNGQMHRCVTACLQDVEPSSAQAVDAGTGQMLNNQVPEIFQSILSNLPAK